MRSLKRCATFSRTFRTVRPRGSLAKPFAGMREATSCFANSKRFPTVLEGFMKRLSALA
jgi:hypothetical protein